METDFQNKILIGAKELFFKHGVKRVTMDDIARHIGMSKKTLYHIFKDFLKPSSSYSIPSI